MKICTLFGAGFCYMPRTDMCLKIRSDRRAATSPPTPREHTAGPIDVGLSTNAVGLGSASNTFSFIAGLSRLLFDFYNAAVQNYRAVSAGRYRWRWLVGMGLYRAVRGRPVGDDLDRRAPNEPGRL